MKTIVLIVITSLPLFCQQIPARDQRVETPTVRAEPQQAGTIVIPVSADLMQSLETARLNLHGKPSIDATGTIKQVPIYATVQEMVNAALRAPNGFFNQIVRSFPSDAIREKIDAAAKAKTAADEATAAGLTQK